jgi:hypothetical protein
VGGRPKAGHDTKTQNDRPAATQKVGPAMKQKELTGNEGSAMTQKNGPAPTRPQSLKIATALVHPADARWTFTGKHTMSNPSAGNCARFPSFSIWK